MSTDKPILQLNNVSVSQGVGERRCQVLKDINLSVSTGEFVAIIGFSGSGKTTLISALAGLIPIDSGTIKFKNKIIQKPGPERAVVFQSYSLLPWLSVQDNIALAVNTVFSAKSKSQRQSIVKHYVSLVGLDHAIDRKPGELSGGMRQRVAVARAMAMKPEILLLDEPLSALDALTRAKLQDEFAQISYEENCTIIHITNDVDEAVLLADRVIPLTPGPKASLAQEFTITIPRPRQRNAMNDNTSFNNMRHNISNTLEKLAEEKRSQVTLAPVLPKVVPITESRIGESTAAKSLAIKGKQITLPEAYLSAAHSPIKRGYVDLAAVKKVFPTPKGPLTVVEDFTLKMHRGEFVSLIGHSGCGKSTVLSMIAGLSEISHGGIILNGREISGASPERAVVFQTPSLMPWLSAQENVALGVDKVYPKASPKERADIVDYYLHRVGLGDSLHKLAEDLSNGMKQRVGIARAFALSPKLLLLDEPFGMLDSLTRWDLQEVLTDIWSKTQVSTICVTHDVDEAILFADRVVMMTNGPHARIGKIMAVNLPRPRSRRELLAHPDYKAYRGEVYDFLESFDKNNSSTPGSRLKTNKNAA